MIHRAWKARGTSSHYLPFFWIVGVASVLAYRFFRLIDQDAVNILFWDQWDLAGSYFSKDVPLRKLFSLQPGPPRMSVGIIFEKLLFDATVWNTWAEAFALGVVVVLALGVALHLKQRLFGPWNAWDFILPLMFFTPQQYQVLSARSSRPMARFPSCWFFSIALLGR